jgi:hypothetical protein
MSTPPASQDQNPESENRKPRKQNNLRQWTGHPDEDSQYMEHAEDHNHSTTLPEQKAIAEPAEILVHRSLTLSRPQYRGISPTKPWTRLDEVCLINVVLCLRQRPVPPGLPAEERLAQCSQRHMVKAQSR